METELNRLSAMDKTTIRVLSPIRAGAASGSTITLGNKNHKSAYLLYRRGFVASAPCRKCIKSCRPYNECIVSPSVGGVALYTGACCNCLAAGKGSECSLREAFEGAGGLNIDPGSIGYVSLPPSKVPC